jgi:hypothetical protein
MSEHTHVYETPTNPTAQVASPSATAPPCDDIQYHAVHHHQMIREREVDQDTILGDHLPDGQGGCHRSTDLPPSYHGSSSFEQGTLSRAKLLFGASDYYPLLLRWALASSLSNEIDASCRNTNCSAADVSCALNSPITNSHRGRRCLPGATVLERLIEVLKFSSLGPAAESDCCSGHTLKHVSESEQIITTGPACDIIGDTRGVTRACAIQAPFVRPSLIMMWSRRRAQ